MPYYENILDMLQYYDAADFKITQDKKDIPAPGRVDFWASENDKQLAEYVKYLQRDDRIYPDKLTWDQFHVVFCLRSKDNFHSHPQYLHVF